MLVVAVALVNAEGEVLVAQRPAGKQHAGLWEFPGGKVEAGETPRAALGRELREELGIEIDAAALSPAAFSESPDASIVLLLYRCRSWRREPRALDAADIRWVAPDMLGAFAMPPADVPLAAALAAER
ncbi:(deoxy)nucleoside triphosphate pyrophosphohydrolase [Sphingomonas sp.]|jgi:8-oxo-dGTP diphosphatase|uniref:(deoxy)nucleoside triphosphate pyrophosphohydrolase n=1 Tax=Sphingomonas sp. TaxID=28214 RepID=UPI002E33A9C6|nr:(deoxy)nucleoside triphosphate pyrophosphohydrolase [Sphingomonas sp.]HEX4693883.1 (deoxy)nucleoside triphosphate pyrophosphohydrolase [Sphingomonas sp.]